MKIRDGIIKEGQSDWYSTYQDLVYEVGRFDINKRRFPLVEGTLHYNEKPDFEKTVDELKKKYIFLAENSLFLLSPLLFNVGVLRKNMGKNIDLLSYDYDSDGCLASDIYLSVLLEEFLFNNNFQDSHLYKKIMELKENPKYLEKVKKGLSLLEKANFVEDITNVDLAMYCLLRMVRGYILGQKDCVNKQKKLLILDEFFRVNRYTNNDIVWKSGYELTEEDIKNNMHNLSTDFWVHTDLPITSVASRGIGHTEFIYGFNFKKGLFHNSLSYNQLSEKDKQDIYLALHDELPWDLEINCVFEQSDLNFMIDERLKRPDDTKPCGQMFSIKEGNIFVHANNFYHLCGNCGYIVKVPPALLSDGIKTRIKDRCNKDPNLFRKMELISELRALDDQSLPHHKLLFKTTNN